MTLFLRVLCLTVRSHMRIDCVVRLKFQFYLYFIQPVTAIAAAAGRIHTRHYARSVHAKAQGQLFVKAISQEMTRGDDGGLEIDGRSHALFRPGPGGGRHAI